MYSISVATSNNAVMTFSHRSIVARCTGVVEVPGLMAVKGPDFSEDMRVRTGTLVLLGSLSDRRGDGIRSIRVRGQFSQ